MQITTIGLDLAEHWFQVHGVDAHGHVVVRPRLWCSGVIPYFRSLGMTPRQNSSGGKERLGRTSKRGDKYIRSLLTAGAVAVPRHARHRPTRDGEWVRALLAGEGSFRAVGIAADRALSMRG